MSRVSGWRVVAHVILVLSLLFNLRMNVNINLDQLTEGKHMDKIIKQSMLLNNRNASQKTEKLTKATVTNCMGARTRRSA
jgi:hypothetical protein